MASMLSFYPCVILPWTREWSTCEESMNTFYYSGFVSGQHVEIRPAFSVALVSSVVGMSRDYEYVLLLWLREWSTCCDSMNVLFYFGLESGQRVEIIPMLFVALASRVVNMSRCY